MLSACAGVENANARTCTTPAALATAHIEPPGCSFTRASAGVMVTLRRAAPRSGRAPVSGSGLGSSFGSIGGASAGETIVRNRKAPSASSRWGSSDEESRPESASRAAASEDASSVASADARRRANTYRLPVFAPSTTCVSSASRHRKRTRGPTTLARSDVSATARQREWAATIVLGSAAPARSSRVRRPKRGRTAARLGGGSPQRCPLSSRAVLPRTHRRGAACRATWGITMEQTRVDWRCYGGRLSEVRYNVSGLSARTQSRHSMARQSPKKHRVKRATRRRKRDERRVSFLR